MARTEQQLDFEQVVESIVAVLRDLERRFQVTATTEDPSPYARMPYGMRLTLRPDAPAGAPVDVVIGSEEEVVLGVGHGGQIELAGSPRKVVDAVRDILEGVAENGARETTRVKRSGASTNVLRVVTRAHPRGVVARTSSFATLGPEGEHVHQRYAPRDPTGPDH